MTDESSYKDKLILTITEASWQYTDTQAVITHSLIVNHFDISMSCDTATSIPTSKLIRGPVVTRGNKNTFPANMGTLVLQDCDGNVLEAYCAYPNGKSIGECHRQYVCVCVCLSVLVCVCVYVNACKCVCMCNRRHSKEDLHLPYIIYCMYVCMYICVRMHGARAGAHLVTKSY